MWAAVRVALATGCPVIRAGYITWDGLPVGHHKQRTHHMRRIVFYEGPSPIDGSPIIGITQDLDYQSANAKTGDLVQTYLMHRDIAPHDAIRSGDDVAVCGDCGHRSVASGGSGACYVLAFRGPLAVWQAYHRGNVIRPDVSELPAHLDGRMVRMGTYGNPSVVPSPTWRAMLQDAKGWTGYDHRWPDLDASEWADLVMASVDTPAEATIAHSLGWRTFRTRLATEALQPWERVCPAAEEAGKVLDCASCRQCDGTSRGARRPSVAIVAHGPKVNRYTGWRKAEGGA